MEVQISKSLNRRTARERVMQTLYAFIVGGESIDILAENIIYPELKERPELLDFAARLLRLAYSKREEYNKIILQTTDNWDISRIAPIDKALIYMGIAEFENFEEIPTKVTINELIEIAKMYSTEKSGEFINGMLDTALEYLIKNDLVKKSGRGLVNGQIR